MAKRKLVPPLRGKPLRQWIRPPKLRAWREYRKLTDPRMTTEGLAELAGVSAGLVSQIETGLSNGSPDSLQKLASALKCTVPELFEDPIPGRMRLNIAVPEAEYDRIAAAVLALISHSN